MINEVRTLLLNRAGASRPGPDFFLEEYVDPAFVPVPLPSQLLSVHNLLLGADSDDAALNFRLKQYMQVLHATEFEKYVLALDPRITYQLDRSVLDAVFEPVVSALNAAAQASRLEIVGALFRPSVQTRLKYDWVVKALSSSVLETSLLTPALSVSTVISDDKGLSTPASLAGQRNMFVRVGMTVTTGAEWSISLLDKPVTDLAALLAGITAGQNALEVLFSADEPFNTFGELWHEHPYLQYRLSGLLLAYVYRVEALRRHA